MEIDRVDGRTANQLRPLACSRSVLNRAHGSASWSQGDTKVLAGVYGPKAGTKKNENPEKTCIEVIWKPCTGQIGGTIKPLVALFLTNKFDGIWDIIFTLKLKGNPEKEYEMIVKRTLQSICILTIHPNTTISVIVQVVSDDGSVSFMLLPCAINAACAALVDAGIPLKHLAVAICCCLAESGYVILDPTKLEEQKMKAFTYLVFPNSILSGLTEGSLKMEGEPMEHAIITSVTRGAMSVDDYLHCLERGRAASAKMSAFLRRSLQPQVSTDSSKAG
ncbi:hypothetical protein CJ030_MR8G014185 [Morella rubra]|uniref:Exosome complex exonuclease RRP46 homolog n=1 Tax=Morella rubra TaxID=262757 RepID=A0A6A1UVA4_9ROSI|nr:hypothetical protein CJ030_MR8G014185 [Morella rubra]